MKKLALCAAALFFLAGNLNAQELPKKIKSFLDGYYSSEELGKWKAAPGACGDGKSVITGDFDGDGQTDYLVRFTTGKAEETTQLHLIAFFNEGGEFTPNPFFEASFDERMKSSSSWIVPKGTEVSLGLGEEGEGPTLVLKTDGIMWGVCETDDIVTFVYQQGEMKDVAEVGAMTEEESGAGSPTIIESSDKSKQVPESIDEYLSQKFEGWEMAPESELCGERKLFMSGDFDDDGNKDYVIQFVANNKAGSRSLRLYAFIYKASGYYPILIADTDDEEDFEMMSFAVIEKGTEVNPGYGEEGNQVHLMKLKADAVVFFKCETDASSTYVFQNDTFKNIRD